MTRLPAARVVVLAEHPFTPDQYAVLQPLADGRTMGQVARALGITRGTVEHRVARMRETTSTDTTAHLVAHAVRQGWIA